MKPRNENMQAQSGLESSRKHSLPNSLSIIGFGLYVLLVSALLLLFAELIVRVSFPQINFQGSQRSLFVEKRFNQTMGLASNAAGIIYGQEIHTDEHGFREMKSPESYAKSLLFLGDSVTFGVGTETKEIYPQLIQNELPDRKIWNTAVPGYNTLSYLDVADVFLRTHAQVERIILFFCLNDVYGNFPFSPGEVTLRERITSFLRSNSKLYLFIKGTFFDRSKTYALHDVAVYETIDLDSDEHLRAVTEIKALAEERDIDFSVIILPYEYQLRAKGLRTPQTKLVEYFRRHEIQYIDLFDEFTEAHSQDYYLFGDAMHFSPRGHETVAANLIVYLQPSKE